MARIVGIWAFGLSACASQSHAPNGGGAGGSDVVSGSGGAGGAPASGGSTGSGGGTGGVSCPVDAGGSAGSGGGVDAAPPTGFVCNQVTAMTLTRE